MYAIFGACVGGGIRLTTVTKTFLVQEVKTFGNLECNIGVNLGVLVPEAM